MVPTRRSGLSTGSASETRRESSFSRYRGKRATSSVLCCCIKGRVPQPDSGELRLGYLVSESQWGRGFATELVRGVVNWVRVRGFRSIIAGVAKGNASSIRVLEKTGFSRTESDKPRRSRDLLHIRTLTAHSDSNRPGTPRVPLLLAPDACPCPRVGDG